jgi:hypothetical protein
MIKHALYPEQLSLIFKSRPVPIHGYPLLFKKYPLIFPGCTNLADNQAGHLLFFITAYETIMSQTKLFWL